MISAAGTVGRSAQSENDYAHAAACGTENGVVGAGYSVGIVNQVLGILQSRGTERGVDVDRDASAGTGADELRRPLITWPLRCWRASRAHSALRLDAGSCLDPMMLHGISVSRYGEKFRPAVANSLIYLNRVRSLRFSLKQACRG